MSINGYKCLAITTISGPFYALLSSQKQLNILHIFDMNIKFTSYNLAVVSSRSMGLALEIKNVFSFK